MKKLKISILVILGLILMRCANQIDDFPLEFKGIEKGYADSIYVRECVNNIYNSLPTGYNRIDGAMLACVTDEAVHCDNSSSAINVSRGIWGPTSNPDNRWTANYAGIRKANNFLLNVLPNIPDRVFKSQQTLDILTGQVYFLRAMFHFELVKRHGGVPIVTEMFEADSETKMSRNTYDECIDFIVSQCDLAASMLPAVYPNDNKTDLGRITKGAAYALKARALLYAASPLFNDPGKTTGSYENGAYSAAKWEKAAEAAHDVIALGVYNLYADYGNFFTTLTSNKEIVLSRMEAASNAVEKANGPSGHTGGAGGTGPSLNLVDAYEMKDGTKFDWNNPTMASNPFANRDPRLAKSVLYNGVSWMGATVDTYEGGDDMGSVNSTRTGFYLRKMLSATAKWYGVTGTAYHCFPIIRYAEVLLNYAEAMNEAYGPEADPKGYGLSAKQAVEMIRQRAGLSPYLVATGLSKDAMREIIRHERFVELAFEEHRHLDVRRWKIAESTLGGTIYGLKAVLNESGTFTYTKVKVEDRVFSSKMYLYPIPQSELNWNSALVQNTGW